MLFNSLNFLIFFPIVTAVYFFLPHKLRWFFLLLASCYFYMCFVPKYILILGFTITIDYFAGLMIARTKGDKKKLFLIISIIANIGILFVFKYFNFFNQNLASLATFLHWNYSLKSLSILLPIGLSFHTFQSLAYIIEVYRGRQPAEKNPGIFALYVMFYPQLVAGPIERPQNLIHQFYEKHYLNWRRIFSGLELMLWGLFKKVVIADILAKYVNIVYDNPASYSRWPLIIATILFSFQIFCDFSGYSDIAVGAARVMGFKLMDNFKKPFSAKSIAEFWRRWHISLSSWFNDYLFNPLYFKFSRMNIIKKAGPKLKHHFAFILSTLIGITLLGLWHGAKWTFVFFGLYHSLMIISYYLFRKSWDKMPNYIKITLNFIIVCVGQIFFRADNLKTSFLILNKIFLSWNFSSLAIYINNFTNIFKNLDFTDTQLWAFFGIAVILAIEFFDIKKLIKELDLFSKLWSAYIFRYFIHWFLISSAIILILFLSQTGSQPFIYFQF